MMSPDFIALSEHASVGDALDAVRRSTIAPGMLTTVYLHDAEGVLSGSAAIVALLRTEPGARSRGSPSPSPSRCRPTPTCRRSRGR